MKLCSMKLCSMKLCSTKLRSNRPSLSIFQSRPITSDLHRSRTSTPPPTHLHPNLTSPLQPFNQPSISRQASHNRTILLQLPAQQPSRKKISPPLKSSPRCAQVVDGSCRCRLQHLKRKSQTRLCGKKPQSQHVSAKVQKGKIGVDLVLVYGSQSRPKRGSRSSMEVVVVVCRSRKN